MTYNFRKIEKKWQKKWEDKKIFEVKEDSKKKKYYVLDMFPYPSGEGLHMGHAFVFSLGDIFARFKRLQGYNVLYPIGYDALGLPAENAAIKAKTHPSDYTKKSIANFMKQQKAMGWSYDWSRLVNTSNPDFYKWDQWIFLKMLEKGIAYRKKAPVNWCPKCKTVLANEQVVNGKCWRHEDTAVVIKHLEQWFFKITDYADELLDKLDDLDWPDNAKKLQKNWIGKSYGTEINFEVETPAHKGCTLEPKKEKWSIFTTRPDTLYGVTFMVVSAQHIKLRDLVIGDQEKEVDKFLKKLKSVSAPKGVPSKEGKKELEDFEKEGVFTGSYAINPINGEKIPVYAGNFVVADYGSGMVMAVPAHDQRDFAFAKKYNIPIKVVISSEEQEENIVKIARAYTGEGVLINSGEFNGINSRKAIDEITKSLRKNKLGKKVVQYRLRDWLISRQRYWGTPIPIIYCDKCGIVPVSEKDLPIELPKKVTFGRGNPLKTNKEWMKVKCPRCKGKARRETDTMDTFANSSWYYLRYTDPKNSKFLFDKKKANYWCPIDQYIGGPEHITMHLIYFRFYAKVLRDLGLLKFDEPALRYFTQGIVHGEDGEKMSKSKGNIVEPLGMISKYGADTLRLALISFASSDKDSIWNEKIIFGSHKFLNKVYDYFEKFKVGKTDARIESKLNKTVKEITELVENFKHNLAVIKIRQLFDSFAEKSISKDTANKFLIMLNIYCPYMTEEIWEKLKNKGFIAFAEWPKVDEKKIDEKYELEDQAVDKLVSDIVSILKIISVKGEAPIGVPSSKDFEGKKKKKVYVYTIPRELELYNEEDVSKKVGKLVKIFAVNDKQKYDPTNRSKNTKPGKPGIYLE